MYMAAKTMPIATLEPGNAGRANRHVETFEVCTRLGCWLRWGLWRCRNGVTCESTGNVCSCVETRVAQLRECDCVELTCAERQWDS